MLNPSQIQTIAAACEILATACDTNVETILDCLELEGLITAEDAEEIYLTSPEED